ncbi:hypothetical protein CCACVL1_07491, partial [Corchorus capsularis]
EMEAALVDAFCRLVKQHAKVRVQEEQERINHHLTT